MTDHAEPCCDKWKSGTDHINNFIKLDCIHGGKGYSFDVFQYCPWCGTRVPVKEKEDESAENHTDKKD